MQQSALSSKEFYKIIKERQHTHPDITDSPAKLSALIYTLNHTLKIEKKAFKALRILIRFYRFPLLILVEPFYQRLFAHP